jgi:hypothetical protein
VAPGGPIMMPSDAAPDFDAQLASLMGTLASLDGCLDAIEKVLMRPQTEEERGKFVAPLLKMSLDQLAEWCARNK